MQVPLLALVLLGACAAKMSRVLRAGSVRAALDATSLFPPRLRRPATMAVCLTELCLGAGILATAGRSFHGWADGVRLAASFFFLIAMAALVELREFRPGLGCGCFGELSSKPPGLRSLLRTGLLAAAALASVHGGELALPPAGPAAALDLGILAAEFLLVALLSPELGEVLARLGYAEPCELRVAPPGRALASLRRSRIWRRHAGLVSGAGPADMWRELCWWYLVFPGRDGAAGCDVVFAVEVRARRPAIRAAVVPRSEGPAVAPPPDGPAVLPPADGPPADGHSGEPTADGAVGGTRAAAADGLSPAF
jgi:hypothetical protein